MAREHDDVVEFVASVVGQLVDNPEAVEVTGSIAEDGDLYVEISVSEDDMGKVIGRQGRIIKAIRTLARSITSQYRFRVEVELAE